MAEKGRHDSDPTVPMPASLAQRLLAEEGCAPVPDDDVPTVPDLEVCPSCRGTGMVLEESDRGYRAVRCPKGCKHVRAERT